MKKLIFIFALIPVIGFGQTPEPLVDLSKYHDDTRRWEMTDNNFNFLDGSITALEEEDTESVAYHMFIYFGDSTVSLSYTTSWAHLTNAMDSLFIQYELDGFTVSGDTITITNTGDYTFNAQFTHDGDNGETVSLRFYNVTQTDGIPVAGANTTRAANNFMSTPVEGYYDVTAGDKVVVQYKGDASGTAVFKNGSILIQRLHE